jgi:hypothetical protein
MNFRRGLFRIWIVLSTLWVLGIGSFIALNTNWITSPPAPAPKPAQEAKSLMPALDALMAQEEAQNASVGTPGKNGIPPFPPNGGMVVSNEQPAPESNPIPWKTDLALIFGPPLVFYLLGSALLWIIAGFRSLKTQKAA